MHERQLLLEYINHADVTAGERARMNIEIGVMRFVGASLVLGVMGGSFYVALHAGLDDVLSPTILAWLGVATSLLSALLMHTGGRTVRTKWLARALRRADARSHVHDGVSANGSTFAVPTMLPEQKLEKTDIVKPQVIGALALFVFVPLMGCDGGLCGQLDALPRAPRVLAVGDSILAWNNDRCHGIPERAGLVAGVHVDNRAVSGTVMHEIASQYDAARIDGGPWDVVIVDGGGNDVNSFCECGACDAVLDDVRTRTNDLLDVMRDDGARVVLVDYFGFDERAWYGFDRCEQALADLQATHEEIDGERDDVTLVDLGALVTPDDHPEAYTFDYVHPSDEGSRILGELLAESLQPLVDAP
jgi:acyl-CoA thioesterase I